MVTDVSNELQLEPLFEPSSPYIVCAPPSSSDLSFDDLELPFPELFEVENGFDDSLRKAGQLVIDPALYHGACADMERMFAEMSSGKKRTAAGVDDNPPAPKIPKAAPVAPESAPTSSENKPPELPVISAVVTKAEPSSGIVTSPPRVQKARRSKGKPRHYGSSAGASTSAAAASGTVDVLQTVAALKAAKQPVTLSTGPVDRPPSRSGGTATATVTSESEQSSDEHVAEPAESFSQALAKPVRSKAVWKPVRDRAYILDDDELDVIWYFGSHRVQAGNAATPDYAVACLGISSIEEQLYVNSLYKPAPIEVLCDDDPTMTSGPYKHKFKQAVGRSMTSIAPNYDYPPRTYCNGCGMMCTRNDLHRFCCPCCAKEHGLMCPLNGLCKNCLLMNKIDLVARYNAMVAAVRSEAAGTNTEPRPAPHRMACQYDCNIAMLEAFKKKNKCVPPGVTRPGLALETLQTPRADRVPVPVIEEETTDPDVEPFLPYRHGRRQSQKTNREQASELEMLETLPTNAVPGRLLTLTEVKHLHKQFHRPLGLEARVQRGTEKKDFVRDYKRATFCRRQPPDPEEEKRKPKPKPRAPLELPPRKRVKVEFCTAAQMQASDNDAVAFVKVDATVVQMYRRSATNQITRDDKRDTWPNYAEHWDTAPRRRVYNVINKPAEKVPENAECVWWNPLFDRYTWWAPLGPYQPKLTLLSRHAVPLPDDRAEETLVSEDMSAAAAAESAIVSAPAGDATPTAASAIGTALQAVHTQDASFASPSSRPTDLSTGPVDRAESTAMLVDEGVDDDGPTSTLAPLDTMTSATWLHDFVMENVAYVQSSGQPVATDTVPIGTESAGASVVYDASLPASSSDAVVSMAMQLAPPVLPPPNLYMPVSDSAMIVSAPDSGLALTFAGVAAAAAGDSTSVMPAPLDFSSTSDIVKRATSLSIDSADSSPQRATLSGDTTAPAATSAAPEVENLAETMTTSWTAEAPRTDDQRIETAPFAVPAVIAAAGSHLASPLPSARASGMSTPASVVVSVPLASLSDGADDPWVETVRSMLLTRSATASPATVPVPGESVEPPSTDVVTSQPETVAANSGVVVAAAPEEAAAAVATAPRDLSTGPVDRSDSPPPNRYRARKRRYRPDETEIDVMLGSPLGVFLSNALYLIPNDAPLALLAAATLIDTRLVVWATKTRTERAAKELFIAARAFRRRGDDLDLYTELQAPAEIECVRGLMGSFEHELQPALWSDRDALMAAVCMDRTVSTATELKPAACADLALWVALIDDRDIARMLGLARAGLQRVALRVDLRTHLDEDVFGIDPASSSYDFWQMVLGTVPADPAQIEEAAVAPPAVQTPRQGSALAQSTASTPLESVSARASAHNESTDSFVTAQTSGTYATAITSFGRQHIRSRRSSMNASPVAAEQPRLVGIPQMVPDEPLAPSADALDLAIPLRLTHELQRFYYVSVDVAAWRIERQLRGSADP